MVQAADMHRPFHLQLLPMGALPDRITHLEIVQHAVGERTLSQQNLLSLGEGVKLSNICDKRDLTIAIFSGNGHLTVQSEYVYLEPGVFIFIPAFTPHTLQATSQLTFLLSRCESTATSSESAWVINLW